MMGVLNICGRIFGCHNCGCYWDLFGRGLGYLRFVSVINSTKKQLFHIPHSYQIIEWKNLFIITLDFSFICQQNTLGMALLYSECCRNVTINKLKTASTLVLELYRLNCILEKSLHQYHPHSLCLSCQDH
jgi:hypothetical protein